MGTRCTVAVKTKNKIASIVVFLDGFPQWSGTMLNEFWNSQDRAEKLVSFGGMKYIPSDVMSPEYYPQEDHSRGPFVFNPLRRKIASLTKRECKDLEKYGLEHNGRPWWRVEPHTHKHRSYADAIKYAYNEARWFYYWDGTEWGVNGIKLLEVLEKIQLGIIEDDTEPTDELAEFFSKLLQA